jgi:Transposase DDE domain
MSILDTLIAEFKGLCSRFTDLRQPSPNLQYSIQDIVLAAFSVFFIQSPSFLDSQKQLERKYGLSNAQTLFGLDKIPTDNHIRKVLDKTPSSTLVPMFQNLFERLRDSDVFQKFTVLNDRILIALDGTQHHSSTDISCPSCNSKTAKNGVTTYYHSFIGASLCAPGNNTVLSLPPEFITPQDGHDKQDCENAAAKRWLNQYGAYYAPEKAIILGDDLYASQPLCEAVLEQNLDFILVCKETSHKVLYDFISNAEMETVSIREKSGPDRGRITRLRFINKVPLNGNSDPLLVNWVGIEVTDRNGKKGYTGAFVTSIKITADTVASIAEAGRARWKVENETFNTLKNKGYHLEHNFGHGKENLCNLFATMNLLAFNFHTMAELLDEKYKTIQEKLRRRVGFFEEIRTLTKYVLFNSWDALFDEILDSFKPRDSTRQKP